MLAALLAKFFGKSKPRRPEPPRRFRPCVEILEDRLAPAGTPYQLEFLQQPSQAYAGQVIQPATVVEILDASGNLVTTATDQIELLDDLGSQPVLGTATVNAVGGIATFNNIYINYAAPNNVLFPIDQNANLGTATFSNPFPVLPVPTSTSVSATPNPSTYGQSVTFTVTVTALPPSGGAFYNIPGGPIQLVEGGTILTTIGPNGVAGNDQATWTTSNLPIGNDPIEAIYLGNSAPNTFASHNFLRSTATMTQVVANTPPTLLVFGNQTNNQGDTVSLQLLGSDLDGDTLSYSAPGLPAGLAISPSTGLISGTVTAGAGTYNVVATVTDSAGLSASQSFTWTVIGINTPPTLLSPGSQTSNEGATVSLPLQGSDSDGDTLSYSIVGLPAGLGFSSTTGLISGTLTASPGQYTATATVTDSYGYSSSQTFTWTVKTALPPVANDDAYAVAEDQGLNVSVANGVLANDTDPQGQSLSAILQSGPANGKLTLNSDGSFQYLPNSGFVGIDSFAYQVVDSGGLKSYYAIAEIVVQAKPAKQGPPTIGPKVVPGNSIYYFTVTFPSLVQPNQLGSHPWTVTSSVAGSASIFKTYTIRPVPGVNGSLIGLGVEVRFENTPAIDAIYLNYSIAGQGDFQSIPITVDVVQVAVGKANFFAQGKATAAKGGNLDFLARNPSASVVATHAPGSDYNAFKVTQREPVNDTGEPSVAVNTAGGAQQAFEASTVVTLNAPAGRQGDQTHILVGFIQTEQVESGLATYQGGNQRVYTNAIQNVKSLDWAGSSITGPGPNAQWPWYDPAAALWKPTAADKNNHGLSTSDTPLRVFPAQWNPLGGVGLPVGTQPLVSAFEKDHFVINVGASTKDTENGANLLYWSEASANWHLTTTYSKPAGVADATATAKVTFDNGWTINTKPTSIDVNVVPSVIYNNFPDRTWEPKLKPKGRK